MTIDEILSWVDRKFPNQESDANKVIDLDMVHKKVYMQLRKLSNDFVIYEDVTVAGQTFYNLPIGGKCKIEDIVRIDVETGVGTDEFDTFEYAGVKDEITDSQVYMRGESGTYALLDNEVPISAAGKKIMMYYYPRPATLTSSDLTAVPDLDTDYHPVLCYMLINELASQGNNPDTEIADYYQKKADEFLKEVFLALAEKQANARTKSNECDEIW